jgi:hypothetical protein
MRIIILLVSLAFIGACASPNRYGSLPSSNNNKYFPPPADYVPLDQIKIKQNFNIVSLTKENLASELVKCVSFLDPNSENVRRNVNDFPLKNATVTVSHKSSSKVFMYRDTTGLCLEYSSNKYPIYAVETFFETANPTGVSPDITNEWYRKIAMQIAIKGQAKIIYATSKGTAFIVSYWSDQTGGNLLNYSSVFKKAGEWESMQTDFKFTQAEIQGFSETKRGDRSVKSFPLAHGF